MMDNFQHLPHFHDTLWTHILGWKPSPVTLIADFVSGISFLVLCIQCSLFIESNSRHHLSLVVLRGLLAIPAIISYFDAIIAPHITESRHFASAAATIGSYGVFKTWEICFAPLFDNAPLPNWVPLLKRKAEINGTHPNGTTNGHQTDGEKAVSLSKDKSRVLYSLDFITNLRGVSWFSDRRFDFLAPCFIQEQNRTPARRPFIKGRLIHLLLVLMAYDVFDTIDKSQRWMTMPRLVEARTSSTTIISPLDPAFAHQVTNLPFYQQAAFVLSTAVTTQLSLEVFYTLLALACVGIFNVSPKAFPHFYNNPFSLRTNSVRSFWGERWHHIFRRVFDRAIDPWMHVMRIDKKSAAGKLIRVVAVFSLSGLLHCLIQARVQLHHFPPGYQPPLFDRDTLSFFLSQPLALLFEMAILHPILEQLPVSVSWWICRIWTWGWLFWTGRWWTNCWVKMGMWQPDEQVVFFSPIRGVLRGEWIVKPY